MERGSVRLSGKSNVTVELDNVVITGADKWTNFTASGNGNYVSNDTVPGMVEPQYTNDPVNTNLCDTSRDPDRTCKQVEQVFSDDEWIEQLPDGSDPGAGEFSMDGSRHIVLGFDPSGHNVEVTTRQDGFDFGSGTSGSVIDGNGTSKITRVATSTAGANTPGGARVESGAALMNNGSSVTYKDIEVSWTSGQGARCGGANCQINGLYAHHNGVFGISSHAGTDFDVTNSHFAYNCAGADGGMADVEYDSDFECAGLKVTGVASNQRSFTNSEYDHNGNANWWADVSADNLVFSGNRVHHGGDKGLFIEISNNIKVDNNVIWENGWKEPVTTTFVNAGVYNSDCGNVDVTNNILAWNENSFGYLGDGRNSDNTGNSVTGNVMIMGKASNGGTYTGSDKRQLVTWNRQSDNLGSGDLANSNRYYYGGQQNTGTVKFQFNTTGYASLTAFQGTQGDGSGSAWIGWSEAQNALTADGVPTSSSH
jgi:hypothetical protein